MIPGWLRRIHGAERPASGPGGSERFPYVLSATEASKRIPDGALIEVNGDTATVTILEHAPEPAGG
jgi:hypothetical protein